MDLRAGQLLHHYVLLRHVGSGGVATVWAAHREGSETVVALKLLRAPQHPDSGARTRLLREAHATRTIVHPAIVPVEEVLDWQGTPALVMELLSGETLRTLLTRAGRLPLGNAAALLVPVAEALARAHAAGIVHRDLKPENIFIQATGPDGSPERVRLLDFGIARFFEPPAGTDISQLTGFETLLGTVAYMSPEQATRPSDIDARADVWALGVTLYEMLSGVRPVEGINPPDTMRRLLLGGIVPVEVLVPDLPKEVTDLIGVMLSRNIEKRPADLDAIAALLRRHIEFH